MVLRDNSASLKVSWRPSRSLSPPLPEQRAIAAFLDHETARLDALIARKERLIELLEEKRTALISHAVTRGLDPTVPLKESGVPWLGKVPVGWEVRRLKHIAEIRSGTAKGRDFGSRPTIELPYLRVANVQDGYLDLSDVATIIIARDEIERYSLQRGDVLMNEGGDFDKLGRGYVWDGSISPCVHQNHVFAVRPKPGINPRWINMITLTSYAKHYFILKSKQTTNLASISGTSLQETPILLPSNEEQNRILNYLDRETARLDALIAKVQQGIELLREYRTALISAAVTGKIQIVERDAPCTGVQPAIVNQTSEGKGATHARPDREEL
jgi:type I restriction enzyme S subunit